MSLTAIFFLLFFPPNRHKLILAANATLRSEREQYRIICIFLTHAICLGYITETHIYWLPLCRRWVTQSRLKVTTFGWLFFGGNKNFLGNFILYLPFLLLLLLLQRNAGCFFPRLSHKVAALKFRSNLTSPAALRHRRRASPGALITSN